MSDLFITKEVFLLYPLLWFECVVSLSLKFKSEIGSQDGSKLWYDHLTKVLHMIQVRCVLLDSLVFFCRILVAIAWTDKQFQTWCMAWKLVWN